MSKKVGLGLAVSGLVVAGLALPLMRISGTARADEAEQQEKSVLVSPSGLTKPVDETVYVFLDANGNVKKTISSEWSKNDLGTDVYSKTEGKVSTPISMKVSYLLDGKEVSAEEIRGRSGRVKIRYDFTNNERVNGMYLPIAVLSGAVLPNGTFSNVKLTNAKLINDGTRTVVAGLALPGMKENLGVNIDLPEYFEIEADVKEFKMEMTATIATSKIFADLDLTALNSVDALSSALQTLSDSMLQLLDGSVKLRDGLATLNSKTSILADGVSQLRAGSLQLVTGTSDLAGGLKKVYAGSGELAKNLTSAYDGSKALAAGTSSAHDVAKQLDAGADKIIESINGLTGGFAQLNQDDANTKLISAATELFNGTIGKLAEYGITADNYETALTAAIEQYKAAGQAAKAEELSVYLAQLKLYSGVIRYISGVNQIAAGVADAPSGAASLKKGTSGLASGLATLDQNMSGLSGGLEKLSAGATDLSNGLSAIYNGSEKLAAGLASLDAGVSNLQSNIPALTSGVSQLADGSKALTDGLSQFNDAGVQKLVSLYNGNVRALISKIQAMVNLAKSSNKAKYVYRTDEI